MTPARTAIVALLLLSGGASAETQAPASAAPIGSAATPGAAPAPAPGDAGVRPKRRGLFDAIKAIVRPLVDAPSSQPAPGPEPVSEPVGVPAGPGLPDTTAPALVKPGTVVVPGGPPLQAQPRPSPPGALPTAAAPRPATPVAKPAPPPNRPLAEAPAPLPPDRAGGGLEPVPPPATVAESASPLVAVKPKASRPAWGGMVNLLLGLLVAVGVAACALRLRRVRQIARTRAVLALNPRLDPAADTCSTSGLSLTAPAMAIRARLLPAGYG